jgi:zinc D-Ala-D-Ala carboxypeptidase
VLGRAAAAGSQFAGGYRLADLTSSQTARQRGFAEQFSPPPEVVANLATTVNQVLLPVERIFRQRPRITSAYRAERTNRAVGGAANSQHVSGQAIDYTVPGQTVEETIRRVAGSGQDFDQLIDEFGRWVHHSYNAGRNRRQVLIARKGPDGKTQYRTVSQGGQVYVRKRYRALLALGLVAGAFALYKYYQPEI